MRSMPSSIFTTIDLDGDDGVVDQQAERQDQGAECDPVEHPPGVQHDDENRRQGQRNRSRHDDPDAPAEAQQTDEQAPRRGRRRT